MKLPATAQALVERLVVQLSATDLVILLEALDQDQGELYDALCSALTRLYPAEALEFFGPPDDVHTEEA